jgi:hypothetical protein
MEATLGASREAPRRSPYNDASQAADLEAADLGEHVERVARVRTVVLDRLPDDGSFVRQGCPGHPGAAAGYLSTSAPVIAATMALLAVVLPIPPCHQ